MRTVLFLGAAAIVGGVALLLPRRASAAAVADTPTTPASDGLEFITATARSIAAGVANVTKPRGIRNNNPGNIEDTGTAWIGRTGNDGRYLTFDTPTNGIRALVIVLHSYFTRHGLNTVRGIISRWAPSTENDTTSYVNAVAKSLGVTPDAVLDFKLYVKPLTIAIIRHENGGQQPYSEAQLHDGIAASGKV